jgi:hypothetical protein
MILAIILIGCGFISVLNESDRFIVSFDQKMELSYEDDNDHGTYVASVISAKRSFHCLTYRINWSKIENSNIYFKCFNQLHSMLQNVTGRKYFIYQDNFSKLLYLCIQSQ